MRADRYWMYNRLAPNRKGLTDEFIRGIDEFLSFALSQENFVSNGKIRCPCSRCDNGQFVDTETVKHHLYKFGFVPEYYQWISHGEPYVPIDSFEHNVSVHLESMVNNEPTNPYRTMVLEAAGPSFNVDFDRNDEEPPNQDAKQFYEMLKAAEEPLYNGCRTHTPLSAMSRMLNIKSEFNMSENCFNRILQLMKELLPEDAKLPDDFYRTKQMVKKLGLGYEKIHVCVNGCMLYYGGNKEKKECSVCGHPRYKPNINGDVKQNDIPFKVLRYFPLTPRLKRLYMSTKTAEHMTWHKTTSRESGVMSHPCDGEAWKWFDECHPSFSNEPRNVRLALSADGFSPYGHMAHPYSCWPVILTPYNLPPEMCMDTPYMFLTLLIPGPKSPGQNIDLYLQPLIEELKVLWEVGVETYDSFKKQNFQLRAALMWTINDFPAYGMLSGWSTHGVLSCPYCMELSKAFYLKEGKKPTFFDCHRQFLPCDHSFRKDKKSFYKGKFEKSSPPPRPSGDEVWQQVCGLPKIMEKTSREKFIGNWTKRSIFWDLPYWRTNLIRHNLDVMHIEKNVFDNIFNTVMDVKGKTKDNLKARKDLPLYCNRPNLELKVHDDGKITKPKSAYTLSKEQRKLVCEWVKHLRLPDGYASNLSNCVDMQDYKLSRMKSHDCHVFMERLMPIAFKDLLPEPIWNTLTEISLFFKDLCSNVIQVERMKKLEKNIVVTMCKLEKIFPPGFFDSMEHLPIHLPYEAMVGGPVQYRWMYPFERFLHNLKKKVKNKARVEGSICEAYLIEETSTFCSYYFEPHIQTKLNKVGRHDDGGWVDAPDGCFSIFTHPGRLAGKEQKRYLSDAELSAATTYVLLNCQEIEPFVEIFEEEVKKSSPDVSSEIIEAKINSEFATWFKSYVFDSANGVTDHRIKDLAWGPFREVHTWPQYCVNGYRFHTISHGTNKSTMNSGVLIKGTTSSGEDFESDYYGLLVDIIQLEYPNRTTKRTIVVLFKCEWFDPTINRGWKVHKHYGLVDINHKRRFLKYEPFILAHQSQQVYFSEYPSKKKDRIDWWAVCNIKARSMIESPDLAYQEAEMSISPELILNDELDMLCNVDGEEEEVQDIEEFDFESLSEDDQEEESVEYDFIDDD